MIYQAPLAEQEITRVGKHLQHIDKYGTASATISSYAVVTETYSSQTRLAVTETDLCESRSAVTEKDSSAQSCLTAVTETEPSQTPSTVKGNDLSPICSQTVHYNQDVHDSSPDVNSSLTRRTVSSNEKSSPVQSRIREKGRRLWSKKETKLLEDYFSKWLIHGQTPGKSDIVAFLKNYPDTANLSDWTFVRTKLSNLVRDGRKRRLKNGELLNV